MINFQQMSFLNIEEQFDQGDRNDLANKLYQIEKFSLSLSNSIGSLLIKGRIDIAQWLSQFKKHDFFYILDHMTKFRVAEMKSKKQLLSILQQLFHTRAETYWSHMEMFRIMLYFCRFNCLDVAQWLWTMLDYCRVDSFFNFEKNVTSFIEEMCLLGLSRTTQWILQTVVPVLIRNLNIYVTTANLHQMYEKAFTAACCAHSEKLAIWLHCTYSVQNVTAGFLNACFYGNSSTVQYLLPICSSIATHILSRPLSDRKSRLFNVHDYFEHCCFDKIQISNDWNSVMQMGFEIAVCRGHLETVACFTPFLSHVVTTTTIVSFLYSWIDWFGNYKIFQYQPAMRDWLVRHGFVEEWYDIFLSQKEPPPFNQKEIWIQMAMQRYCTHWQNGQPVEAEAGKWWEMCKSWWTISDTESARDFWNIVTSRCFFWFETKSKRCLRSIWKECMQHFTFDTNLFISRCQLDVHLLASVLCRFRHIWNLPTAVEPIPQFLHILFNLCNIEGRLAILSILESSNGRNHVRLIQSYVKSKWHQRFIVDHLPKWILFKLYVHNSVYKYYWKQILLQDECKNYNVDISSNQTASQYLLSLYAMF